MGEDGAHHSWSLFFSLSWSLFLLLSTTTQGPAHETARTTKFGKDGGSNPTNVFIFFIIFRGGGEGGRRGGRREEGGKEGGREHKPDLIVQELSRFSP